MDFIDVRLVGQIQYLIYQDGWGTLWCHVDDEEEGGYDLGVIDIIQDEEEETKYVLSDKTII